MKTPLLFAAIVFVACSSNIIGAEPEKGAPAPPTAQQAVTLRFDPNGGAWAGETPFKGASWTKLGKGLHKGLWMRAVAGLGDTFPVQEKDGVTLFEVKVIEGNDDRLIVEVRANAESRRVTLPRDKKATVEIAGGTYELVFPTTRVAPRSENEKPTTNKATIFVSRPA